MIMNSVDNKLNDISANEKNHKYGEVKKASVQSLYKRYKAWMKENNPMAEVLSFADWIKWAQKKGIVKNYSSDGESEIKSPAPPQGDMEPKEEIKEVSKVAKNMGKAIGVAVIGVAIIVLAYNLYNNSTNKNQPK